jgi:MFS family permease
MSSVEAVLRAATDESAKKRLVIVAASLGTVFEWYDFFLYGSLAVFFSALFFPPGNETAAFLASLATFGAGFAVRPFGALVFGAMCDRIGRKRTFMITIVIMGLSTVVVGLLPTYAQVGVWAPVLLVLMRLTQGLAVGGEYGGAATYVAEHAPPTRRGFDTSWIQATGTIGFLLSLLVILTCRLSLGDEAFKSWGWRIPFLTSILLLAVSVYILCGSLVPGRDRARDSAGRPDRPAGNERSRDRLAPTCKDGLPAGRGEGRTARRDFPPARSGPTSPRPALRSTLRAAAGRNIR